MFKILLVVFCIFFTMNSNATDYYEGPWSITLPGGGNEVGDSIEIEDKLDILYFESNKPKTIPLSLVRVVDISRANKMSAYVSRAADTYTVTMMDGSVRKIDDASLGSCTEGAVSASGCSLKNALWILRDGKRRYLPIKNFNATMMTSIRRISKEEFEAFAKKQREFESQQAKMLREFESQQAKKAAIANSEREQFLANVAKLRPGDHIKCTATIDDDLYSEGTAQFLDEQALKSGKSISPRLPYGMTCDVLSKKHFFGTIDEFLGLGFSNVRTELFHEQSGRFNTVEIHVFERVKKGKSK